MNFNCRPDDLMRYVIVVHREKNLTQRTQREEHRVHGKQNRLALCIRQGFDYAGQLHHLNVFRTLVPIVPPTDNHIATACRMSVVAEISALKFKLDAHALPSSPPTLSLSLALLTPPFNRSPHTA